MAPPAGGKPVPGPKRRLVAVTAIATVCCMMVVFAALWMVAGEPPEPLPPPVTADVGPLQQKTDEPPYWLDGDALVARPSTPAAFAEIALAPHEPLPPAPDPALLQTGPAGPVPTVGADGRVPRQAYARPFNRRDDRARVVLVIAGIGLSAAGSRAAMDRLPGDVALAIDAYAPDADQWSRWARRAGHEVLATVPLELASFPNDDAGPAAVRAAAPAGDGVRLLERQLNAVKGAVGVLFTGGTAFGDNTAPLEPMLVSLRTRGLLLVNAMRPVGSASARALESTDPPPTVLVDVVIDETPTQIAVDRQLATLANLARERFIAVGLAHVLPVTSKRLRFWIDNLPADRYVLAPVSAAVARVGEQ